LNPGHVDPGFIGPLSVKAINLRNVPLPITRKDPIFTVIFEKLPNETPGYGRNVTREERERSINKKDLEVTPRDLSSMLTNSDDCPFALSTDVKAFQTEAQVKQIVLTHWMTWITLILALVAAITGIVAVYGSNNSQQPVTDQLILELLSRRTSHTDNRSQDQSVVDAIALSAITPSRSLDQNQPNQPPKETP